MVNTFKLKKIYRYYVSYEMNYISREQKTAAVKEPAVLVPSLSMARLPKPAHRKPADWSRNPLLR
jgi:hypothetical protein